MGNTADYDADFYGWAMEQARLLREGSTEGLDLANLAEEVEGIGRREKRELCDRLAALLFYLLRGQYQPYMRDKSWRMAIDDLRQQVAERIEENPSLRSGIDAVMATAYEEATLRAEIETYYLRDMFPWSCPYSFERVIDDEFWPDPI